MLTANAAFVSKFRTLEAENKSNIHRNSSIANSRSFNQDTHRCICLVAGRASRKPSIVGRVGLEHASKPVRSAISWSLQFEIVQLWSFL
jgi:hypothetical protein